MDEADEANGADKAVITALEANKWALLLACKSRRPFVRVAHFRIGD